MSVLTANNLDLTISGIHILSKVSFAVQLGSIHAVIGPNGAGKTSLMNCITGYYRPARGKVVFQDEEITSMAPHKVANFGISRMFQHIEIVGELSVLDNVLLGRHTRLAYNTLQALIYWGKARREEERNRREIQEILDFLKLTGLESQPAGSLAYGTQKRIELARAVVGGARLLILDEPTSGMNRQEKQEIIQAILMVRKSFIPTILLIEHDMRVVMEISDFVSVMDFGKLIAEGTTDEIQKDEKVIKAYLGEKRDSVSTWGEGPA